MYKIYILDYTNSGMTLMRDICLHIHVKCAVISI